MYTPWNPGSVGTMGNVDTETDCNETEKLARSEDARQKPICKVVLVALVLLVLMSAVVTLPLTFRVGVVLVDSSSGISAKTKATHAPARLTRSPHTPPPDPTTVPATLGDVMELVPGNGFNRIKLARCALIGASDAMNGNGSGEDIDSYDTVIRINRIPSSEYWGDFGRKTDILFINHVDDWREEIDLMRGGDQPVRASCGDLAECKDAAIIAPAKAATGEDCDLQMMVSAWGLDHPLIGCQHENISAVASSLSTIARFRPSTGFQAFITFLPICQTLDLYGFGGRGTADGHKESRVHGLYQEHVLQDTIIAKEWNKLSWSRRPPVLPWMQAHAAEAKKVVGLVP